MIPVILLTDAYKLDHRRQYPEGTTEVYSNFTARQSRVDGIDEVVFFGLRYYVQRYLIEEFDIWFDMEEDEAVREYEDMVKAYLGPDALGGDFSHIRDLHRLQCLPIRLKALPEGSKVRIGVPVLTIVNTLPQFFWVTNYLETCLSNTLWLPITSATTALDNRNLLDRAYKGRDSNEWFKDWQCHDFSYRGMSSLESACLSGAAHLLSFKGTDTVPAVSFLKKYYSIQDDTIIAGSVAACYCDKTEVLTEKGFVRFQDLDIGVRVAQYHDDGQISFVEPSNYFEDHYVGEMVHFSTLSGFFDNCVTPNHKMVRRTKDNQIEFFEAGDKNSNYCLGNKVILGGLANGEVNKLTALEQLKIAFQADGSFPNRGSSYTSEKTACHPIRFSLKKERKKKRLLEILEVLNYEYSYNEYDNGYASFWIKVPGKRLSKEFDWLNLSEVSHVWAKEFIEELTHWDGNWVKEGNASYYSAVKFNVEQVQAVAALAGYKSCFSSYEDTRGDRQTQYTVSINTNLVEMGGTKVERHYESYDGYVYCVSVPTKKLVVKRNNIVSICGNTEHSVMMANGDDKETFIRLLTDVYPKGIVSVVSDTWDLWHVVGNILPSIKDLIMSRDSKTVIRPDSGSPLLILCGDEKGETELERKGLIEALWDIFGGTVNEYGYKLLDSHIGAIYGDGITYGGMKSILFFLSKKKFAPSNVVFGCGSFFYQYGVSRDTFGFAVKATSVVINGERKAIFKDPKTSKDTNKKSARGLLRVEATTDRGDFILMEDVTEEEEQGGALRRVFENGAQFHSYDNSLEAIRARVAA